MKMVANETELRNTLKEKAQEITIVTSYADTVMKRYSVELTTTWPTISPAVACVVLPLSGFGISNQLRAYKIKSYTPGRMVIERE